MKRFLFLMCLFIAFLSFNCSSVGGCKINSSDSKSGSAKGCWDYSGSGWTVNSAKEHCEVSITGSFSEDGCDVSDSPGVCIVEDGNADEITIEYLSSISNSKAKNACSEVGGTYDS